MFYVQALGKSSLKPEDCIADYSGLDAKELEVLDQWHAFFSKRYNIVGKVVPDN
jgi:membrane-associated progesterone receptor component